jgi:hypothetical protein
MLLQWITIPQALDGIDGRRSLSEEEKLMKFLRWKLFFCELKAYLD